MADFAEDFAASRAPQTNPEATSFDDDFARFRQQQFEDQGRLRVSLMTAAETTPQAAALQKQLSTLTGVPLDVVKTDEGKVKALAKYRELQQQSTYSPVLRDRLMDPNFAAVAQNDGKSLSSIEALFGSFGSGVVGTFAGGTVSGVSTMLDIGARAIDRPIRQAFGDDVANKFWYTPPRIGNFAIDPLDALKVGGQALQNLGKMMEPAADQRSFATDVAAGLGQISGQIGTFIATGGAGSLMQLYAQGISAMDQKVSDDPASQANKDMAMMLGASVTALTEKYALDKILGPLAVPIKNAIGAAVARIGVAAAAEGGQELAENIGQDIIRKFLTKPDAEIDFGDAAYQGSVGATVGSIVRSLVEAALHVKARGQQREIDRAQQHMQMMQDILNTAAGSEVQQMDKASFADFVQAAAEANPNAPKTVFIDGRALADTLAQSGMTEEQIAQILPSVPGQLRDAVAMNSAVEIPIGELTAALPGTGLEQALLPDMRTTANGLSLNEAKARQEQAQQFLEQEAQRVIDQAGDTVRTAAGTEFVRQQIQAQLDTAGRFSPDVNAKGAKLASLFYTVMAGRMNTTPEALYNTLLPYQVRAEGQGTFTQSTFNSVEDLQGALVDIGVETSIYESQGALHLGKIDVDEDKRNQGVGTKAMQEIVAYADKNGLRVTLTPGTDFGASSKSRLVKFYKRFGFVENKGRNKDFAISEGMYREPQAAGQLNQSMSTRLPWAKPKNKEVENPLASQLVVGLDAVARNPKLLEKFATRIGETLSLRTSRAKDPKKRLENYIKQMVDNLLWLHDQMPAELRDRAKLWYDGARAITERLQERYDGRYSDMQVAAVLAVMSPQMDWFTNVTLGERIMDVWDAQQGFRWTPEMTAAAEKVEGFKRYQDELKQIEGKTLGELNDDFLQALWIAAFDRTYHTTDYRIVTPEGDFTELDVTSKNEPAKASWANGFGPIAKAVSVLKDGTAENVSAQLGGMHKVRNFYNNIFAPNANDGSVTVDTHAVAAALLMPFSGTSPEVADNFGAAGSDSLTGIQGTFAIYAEAYRRAAAERGLLPREMQSVTWEAVRGLFSPEFKRKYQKDTSAFDKIWRNYHAGNLELNEARQQLLEFAGGITTPSWAGRDRAQSGERWSSSYAGELLAQSGMDGAALAGAGGDAAAGSATLAQRNEPNRYQQKYLAGRELTSLTPEERAQYDALSTPADTLQQPARGTYDIRSMTTVLNGTADLSTFLHETGHFFLDAIRRMVLSGSATPEVVAMYQGTLKALGVGEEEWNAWHNEYEATGNIPDGLRKAHEKWAESFELYLFTGKAPSVEVQSLFRTFASWLKRVYRSIQEFVARSGTELDPDLKAVMDKMLATDEQIAEAEQIAGLLPNMDATAEAQEKLNARSLRDLQWAINARNKMIKQLQKEAASKRKEVEDEVRAEVEQMPLYAAIRFIKKGEASIDGEEVKATTGHKINTEALAAMYPESMLARPDLTKLKGMTSPKGLPPDVLADSFGFQSGDALIRAIIDAEPMSSVVEGMTDQRMLERYGDLATSEAIAQAATEAVHNEARAKSLATELAAQRDMLNTRRDTGNTNAKGSRVTVNVLVEAAKQFAQNVIGRRKLGELKKATWAHVQAERRAGKAWEAATAKGDTQAAVQAKQDQVLNNAAVRAGQEAQAEVRKALDLFKRVMRGTDEKLVERGFDPDIANAARAILTAYGIAPAKGKSALEYLETLQKNDPTTYNAVAPSVTAALVNAKPFDELTMDELGALKDEIESLWFLARRSRQMEVDGDLLDREDVQEELKDDLETRGIPDVMPGDESAITPKDVALRKLMVFRAAATRVENWAQGMGARFTKYVFQPVKEAADRYRAAKGDYLKKYRALLDAIAPTMVKQTIEAPELNYTFGKDTGGVAMGEILHALTHTGNASNKRKLLLGRGWATENPDGTLDTSRWDAFIARMINTGVLTKAHYDFAQGVWDLLESMKPLAQKTHRDVFGRYFAEVTADSFDTPFGAYRGGYVPAIADSRIVADAATRAVMEEENQSMAFAFPATNRGFTKGRTEYNRPLLLDLRLLAQHIDKVLLFSHLEQPVRDVRRILTAKNVAYGLNRIDPAAFDNVITPWLNRAARQQVETPVPGDAGLMRILSAARNRAGMAAMFANIANSVQQLTGFSIAAVKVKPTYLMAATAQMIAQPKQMIANVADASVYMKERLENETSNAESAIKEILLDPTILERGQAWSAKHAYFLQQAVDNAMGPIIWTGAFNQATAQGLSEKEAVRFADSVIRTTQGSTLPEDVSRIEGGNAFVRLFTQFSSYFNMQANLLGTEISKVTRELGVKKGAGRMLYIMLLGFLAPAWVGEAIIQAFRGGPDDEDKDGEYLDDWLAAVFGWGTLRAGTAMVPAVGQVINAGFNTWNTKPYDDRLATSATVGMIESAVSAPHSVYKAIAEEGNRQKAVRDVATLITLASGLPATFLARPVGYLAGLSDYTINPTSGPDMARGLVTGVASPQSK